MISVPSKVVIKLFIYLSCSVLYFKIFVSALFIFMLRRYINTAYYYLLLLLITNDISDFRCQHLQRKYQISYRNINFSHLILRSSSFMFPLLLITVEVKNTICNSLITMFTTSWRNLIKIGWSELYKMLSFFTKSRFKC